MKLPKETLDWYANNLKQNDEGKEEEIKICEFEAGYERTGCITLEKIECDNCHKIKNCICIDSSDGEYGPGNICENCIKKAFLSLELTKGDE